MLTMNEVYAEIDRMYDYYGDGRCKYDPGQLLYDLLLRMDDGQELRLSSVGLCAGEREWLWLADDDVTDEQDVEGLYNSVYRQCHGTGRWNGLENLPLVIEYRGRRFVPVRLSVWFNREMEDRFDFELRVKECA